MDRGEMESSSLRSHWFRAQRALAPLGGRSSGNCAQIFNDGDDAFDAMWEAIDGAADRVWLETYRFAHDRVGQRTLERLVAAAKRGCEVVVIYDHAGSLSTTDGFFEPLRQAGGKAILFNPLWPWRRRGPFSFRNHRKLLMVDNRIAFCGGMNVAEEYAGRRYGSGLFSDCMVQFGGPCVTDLAAFFVDSWREAEDGDPPPLPPAPPPCGDVEVQVVGSNMRRNVRSIQRALGYSIHSAQRRICLTTPYFLPSLRLRRAIIAAARRGVDVRILVAGPSDVFLMRQAARFVMRSLLRNGVRVFEYCDGVLHKKRASIDGAIGMVGTFNLDHWSDRRNLETGVILFDETLANRLESQFIDDTESAEELTIDQIDGSSFFKRSLNWCAYQLLRL